MSSESGETRVMRAAGESGSLVTPAAIAEDLAKLGVRPGMLLNVHSAMSKLGFVVIPPYSPIQSGTPSRR